MDLRAAIFLVFVSMAAPCFAQDAPSVTQAEDIGAVRARVRAGIRRQDGTITREALRALAENQQTLIRGARIVPQEEDGRVVAVRIFGVRRDSPLGWLGLQNGDAITEVNGRDVTSPEAALQAYSTLFQSDLLEISLIRRGAPTTIRWRIVD
jgi:general secretion pathway protein C